ncbi:MAG: TolC family outer membrane protein [Deltaproteobacteria bacterium]|nr:TolC family outer membrane protein [Deltaproteobacteria bacterium]
MKKILFLSTSVALVWLLFPVQSFSKDVVTIKQSVIDTLKTTPRLEMMKYNREAVKYDLKKSKGGLYPKINARAAYGADRHSDQVTRRENRDHTWHARGEASLVLTQLIFDGKETRSQVEIDKARVRSIDHRVFDNAEALALDAVLAALEVYRQGKLLEIAEENVAAHEKILASLKDMQQAGAGSIADVMQTRARLSRTLTTRITVKNDLQNALSEFERLAGYRPGKVRFPSEKPDVFLPKALDDFLKAVLDNNPKLLTAQADIEAAAHRITLAESKFFPKVFLEVGVTYEDGVEGDEDWSRNYAAMVRMNWNLLNGGSDKAAKSAAFARKLQAEMDRKDLERNLTNEARATWNDYKAALEEEQALKETVKFNEETRTLYRDQFSVGQRSLLDLLDAENEYFQSAGLYVTATVNRVANAYKLLALSGKLIETLGIDASIYKEPKMIQQPERKSVF